MRQMLWIGCLTVIVGLLGTACNEITYEGVYSDDGTFIGSSAIYFDHGASSDTLQTFSFGPLPVEVTAHMVLIPLRITGDTPEESLIYHVVVDENESTAKSGLHFTPLSDSYYFRKGAVTDTLRIELLRANLPTSGEDARMRLVLRLEASDKLQVAFEQENRQVISYDNIIEEPYWWMYYEFYLGPYHEVKYLKFLEDYESDPAKLDESLNNGEFSRFMINAKKLYDYFTAHPEPGVILPDTDPGLYVSFQE